MIMTFLGITILFFILIVLLLFLKKKNFVMIGALVVTVVLFCEITNYMEKSPIEDVAFYTQIASAFEGGKDRIDLSELINFGWDEACLFTTPEADNPDFDGAFYANEYLNKQEINGRKKVERSSVVFLFIKDKTLIKSYNYTPYHDGKILVNGVPVFFSPFNSSSQGSHHLCAPKDKSWLMAMRSKKSVGIYFKEGGRE